MPGILAMSLSDVPPESCETDASVFCLINKATPIMLKRAASFCSIVILFFSCPILVHI